MRIGVAFGCCNGLFDGAITHGLERPNATSFGFSRVSTPVSAFVTVQLSEVAHEEPEGLKGWTPRDARAIDLTSQNMAPMQVSGSTTRAVPLIQGTADTVRPAAPIRIEELHAAFVIEAFG